MGGAYRSLRARRRALLAVSVALALAVSAADAFGAKTVTVARDPTVAAAGDIACGAGSGRASCEQMATSDLLLRLHPTAVLALGDTQYEFGAYSDFLRYYAASWGRLKAITHPAVGNHEYGTSDRNGCGIACGYFDYFNGPGAHDGRAGRRNQGWYAFDLGAWRLYALNSNCDRGPQAKCETGGAQERWLRADLARHPRRCSLAFMHHPLFTSDERPWDNSAFADRLRPLWRTFSRGGGDVMLAAHSHFYERFAPQDPNERRTRRGIRQFIVGTGGRNVYGFGAIEPNSQVRGASTFGVLRVALHRRSYDWRFVPIPGESFTDRGRSRCQNGRALR